MMLMFSNFGMPPRPQLTQDQRNFCLLEYAKRKGGLNFFQGILNDFQTKFPGARRPDQTTVRRLYKKQLKNGTVLIFMLSWHSLNAIFSAVSRWNDLVLGLIWKLRTWGCQNCPCLSESELPVQRYQALIGRFFWDTLYRNIDIKESYLWLER